MTPGARRAKGRRLPAAIADTLARAFNLTVAATHAKHIGRRNGVAYVHEREADLLVRVSGQPGVDIALLTAKATSELTVLFPASAEGTSTRGLWPAIECKNTEGWSVESVLTSGKKTPAPLRLAWAQAVQHAAHETAGSYPCVILGRNRALPLVMVPAMLPLASLPPLCPVLRRWDWVLIDVPTWLQLPATARRV